MRWEIVEPNLESSGSPDGIPTGVRGPGNRWGHTCNAVGGGRLLYVFGGYGMNSRHTNDVFVFDTVTRNWSMPMMSGIPPSPRDSHSCTTVGDNLFVFGGSNGRGPLQDLFILDTLSNRWICPRLAGGPPAREGHSATLVGKHIFIFGGCGISRNGPEEVYFNDVYKLHTETLEWEFVLTSGERPCARDCHTVSSWNNKLVVVSGENTEDEYLSDVHILDTDTLVWRELSTSGENLGSRAGHTTIALGKILFVFGGFAEERTLFNDLRILDLETGIWTKIVATGQGPSARFSVASDCLGSRKGVFVFIGGCNKDLEALDDMYYLYTGIMVENEQDELEPKQLSLRKELRQKCQEDQYLLASLPAKDKDVRDVGLLSDMPQISILPSYGQSDKNDSITYELSPSQELLFKANVTEALHYGYTIETNINGKRLRGVLFSSSRKSPGDEVDEMLPRNCKSKLGIAEHNQQEVVDHKKNNDVHVNEFMSEGSPLVSPAETITTTASDNSTPIIVSLGHMGTINSEISPSPNDDKRLDQLSGGTSLEMFTSPPRDGVNTNALAVEPIRDIKET